MCQQKVNRETPYPRSLRVLILFKNPTIVSGYASQFAIIF